MEREPNDLTELGSVTSDTAGDGGPLFEPAGRMKIPGLEQE